MEKLQEKWKVHAFMFSSVSLFPFFSFGDILDQFLLLFFIGNFKAQKSCDKFSNLFSPNFPRFRFFNLTNKQKKMQGKWSTRIRKWKTRFKCKKKKDEKSCNKRSNEDFVGFKFPRTVFCSQPPPTPLLFPFPW